MSTSEFFWSIMVDIVPLMIPLLCIGIAFSVIKELVFDMVRGGR